MGLNDLSTKKTIVTKTKTMIETTTTTEEKVVKDDTEQKALEKIAPEKIGVLDMVIAFDTTGSMAAYIEAVRQEVAELIPNLFKDNEDLRLGIVAFGDYCDMNNAQDFGDAYQCLMPTNNENDIIKFVRESKDTCGGDGDEFYELVIKKIVEETPWREGSTRVILLISDADPHPLGYTYKDYVVGNQIDWRKEAQKAAEMKIKIDTVTIRETEWYKELSQMTNGISVPFASGHKTARLVEAATNARGSIKARMKFDEMYESCVDEECRNMFASYQAEREKIEE
ncbi:MAG: VWA domain-containing protein [Bacteroidaceae bacterium]|nr:VWA domain-containing protein [Bacteroidaceae bacterium]